MPLGFSVGRTARAGKTGQAFTLLLKVQVLASGSCAGWRGVLLGDPSPFTLHCSLQERRFLRMLGEAGAPELQRHETPSELLQPLIPRYEAALSQLEETVRVRARPQHGLVLGPGTRCWGRHCTKPCVLPQEERKQKAA